MGKYGGGRQPVWREKDREHTKADAMKSGWVRCPICGELWCVGADNDGSVPCDKCAEEEGK